MGQFFVMFVDFWKSIFALLGDTYLPIGNFSVSVLDIFYLFFIIGFVISVFWRGAKT